MNIVVTGSAGFVGKHLVAALRKQNVEVRELNRTKHDVFRPETLRDLMEGADVVVHLLGANRDRDATLLRANTLGTVGVLQSMASCVPNATFIFASSFQVYWENSFYGLTKRLAEEAIEYFVRTTPMRARILRISNIYGPGGKPFYNSVIATFAHLVREGKPLVIHGDGKQKRDYIYVGDVVEAIEKAIYNTKGERLASVDICSGVGTTLNEIIAIMERVGGKAIKKQYEPLTAQEEYEPRNFDNAKRMLGWKPTVSLEEGVRRTVHEDYRRCL